MSDAGVQLPAGVSTRPSTEQIRAIRRLRYRVYVEVMKKPYPGADHVRGELGDASDDTADHLFLDIGGTIVGAVRLTPFPQWRAEVQANLVSGAFRRYTEGSALVSRLVIDPSGRRAGRTAVSLMLAACLLGTHQGLRYGLCHSLPGLTPFFSRFGGRICGAAFFHQFSASPQVPLVFDVADRAYLRRIGSPFAVALDAS